MCMSDKLPCGARTAGARSLNETLRTAVLKAPGGEGGAVRLRHFGFTAP